MTGRLDFDAKTDRFIINELLNPWKPTREENAQSFGMNDIEDKKGGSQRSLQQVEEPDDIVDEDCNHIHIVTPLLNGTNVGGNGV